MNATSFARVTIRGTAWTYAAYYSGKGIVFLTTIILARLLAKDDFGVVAYATLVIGLLDVTNNLGIGSALIYHRENREAPFTAFWLSLVMGLLLFGVAWLSAPWVGGLFAEPRVVPLVRALGCLFPLSSLESVHQALLARDLAFRNRFIPDFLQALSKGLLSIVLAGLGFGAWSLVLGQVGGQFVSVVAYWCVLPWRPAARFTRSLARPLLTYGAGVMASRVLLYLMDNVDYFFVGRFLGATALGVYTLAFRVPDLLIVQFCGVVGSVLFPVYARMRENPEALRRAFLKTMQYVSLVTVPVGLGVALVAEPFVLTFFTDKWADAIPVMRAIALYALFLSLAHNVGHIYKAQGWLKLMTGLSLIRLTGLVPALAWAVTGPADIETVGWVQAAVALAAGLLNLTVAARRLGAAPQSVLVALAPALLAGGVMAAAVLAVLTLTPQLAPVLRLAVSVLLGGGVYLGTLGWWQADLLREIRHTLAAAWPGK